LISILFPVHNAQPYLSQAVDSIFNQTYKNFELLILEDGSTDDSLKYLQTIADPRVKVISDGRNHGLVHQLNLGLTVSKGRYICRMDADDIAFPRRLELQAAYLDANPTVHLVGGRAIAFKSSEQIVGYLPYAANHQELCAQPWNRIPLPHPTWMARKEWYHLHPYRVPAVFRAEDQDLLLSAYSNSRYACLPDVVLAYRLRDVALKVTLATRLALWKAQVSHFYGSNQFVFILLSTAITALKIIYDLITCIPIVHRLINQFKLKKPASDVFEAMQSVFIKKQ